MKVRIYFDVYPWSKPGNLYFFDADSGCISEKSKDCTRYIIEVEIPDPTNLDIVIQAEAKKVP